MLDWLMYRRDGGERRIDPYVIASGSLFFGGLLCSVLCLGVLTLFEPNGTMFVSSLWVVLMLFAWANIGLSLYCYLLFAFYMFEWLIAERLEG